MIKAPAQEGSKNPLMQRRSIICCTSEYECEGQRSEYQRGDSNGPPRQSFHRDFLREAQERRPFYTSCGLPAMVDMVDNRVDLLDVDVLRDG
jgi:hypothetical protein